MGRAEGKLMAFPQPRPTPKQAVEIAEDYVAPLWDDGLIEWNGDILEVKELTDD